MKPRYAFVVVLCLLIYLCCSAVKYYLKQFTLHANVVSTGKGFSSLPGTIQCLTQGILAVCAPNEKDQQTPGRDRDGT
jgi:hypothetical protein